MGCAINQHLIVNVGLWQLQKINDRCKRLLYCIPFCTDPLYSRGINPFSYCAWGVIFMNIYFSSVVWKVSEWMIVISALANITVMIMILVLIKQLYINTKEIKTFTASTFDQCRQSISDKQWLLIKNNLLFSLCDSSKRDQRWWRD